MRVRDLDITSVLRDALPVDSFLFNPSIAEVTGDTYIVSVRSYVHDSSRPLDDDPVLVDNTQHPWGTDWEGSEDATYILPMVITGDKVQPVTSGEWPLKIPVQDMRIFRFIKDETRVGFILTYNERYDGDKELLIKGDKTCENSCYLIGWSYLLIDINTLEYEYLPGRQPLCANISNPVEKNWSLWRYDDEEHVHLLLSYALTPAHETFSFVMKGITEGEIEGGSSCKMVTGKSRGKGNIFKQLEDYYDGKLLVSLSTPSYPVGENGTTYQSVGHLKVKIDYMRGLVNDEENDSPLAAFAQRYMKSGGKKHYNLSYVYMMFVYRFEVSTDHDGEIELTGSKKRAGAKITHVTPAFVCKVTEYDYFLNFPSGMVLDDKHTIISYGNGDATSHLMYMTNKALDDFIEPVSDLTAETFEFLHASKRKDGSIHLT
jgi:hypothetical protein